MLDNTNLTISIRVAAKNPVEGFTVAIMYLKTQVKPSAKIFIDNNQIDFLLLTYKKVHSPSDIKIIKLCYKNLDDYNYVSGHLIYFATNPLKEAEAEAEAISY